MSCNVTSPACILFYNNFRIATNHHLTNSNMMMIRLPSLIICQTIDRQAGRQAVSTQHNTTHRFLDLYAHLMVYIVGSLSMAGQISLVAKVRHTHKHITHLCGPFPFPYMFLLWILFSYILHKEKTKRTI